jgi:oxygen-dependent protoporphyrinogen oxidase
MTRPPRVLVVGAGIAGLAAAHELTRRGDVAVEVWEAGDRVGGKLATSPFAGVDHVDEAADAFLVRIPSAIGLAREVGLGDDLTHPEPAGAAVWHDRLHDIPGGMVLGVPTAVMPFARSGLLSWKGKLRASLEPFLPATDPDDSIGKLVRARFGDEVHERLVDALVGSIYATDTDRSSLAAVPQLADLASNHRSLLLGARAAKTTAPPRDPGAPVFAAPRTGLGGLAAATAAAVRAAGGDIATGRPVSSIDRDGDAWRVDDEPFDAVILATPAEATGPLLRGFAPAAADVLDGFEHADVVMVRLAVPGDSWPERLHGRSGYLVPKPDQRHVTAVSFASQKWAHWRPDDGRQLLRVSLGRDGLPIMHLDDDAIVDATVTEVGRHLELDLQPTDLAISRWHGAFAQYRPHHGARVERIVAALPAGVEVAGASYRGIGVPACIADGRRAARGVLEVLAAGGAPAGLPAPATCDDGDSVTS